MNNSRKIVVSVLIIAAILFSGIAMYNVFAENIAQEEYLSKEEAKRIAFVHAGAEEGTTRNVDVDLEYENGRRIYQVEFDSAEFEFEYTIDAKTGEILYHDKGYNPGSVDYD